MNDTLLHGNGIADAITRNGEALGPDPYALAAIALPAGLDPCSEAVRSVWRRGFHGHMPPAATDSAVMAQFVRLVEEAGEFDQARRRLKDHHVQAAELADVLIVASNLAWVTGLDPAILSEARFGPLRELWPLVADLARALRRYDRDRRPIWDALKEIAAYCWTEASKPALATNLAGVMADKLAADEGRGRLHGDSGAAPTMKRGPYVGVAVYPYGDEDDG